VDSRGIHWIPLEFDLFQWITVDYSGFKRNPLESTGKYSIWTGLEFLWTQNSSPFQLEFIPVKSENLADVECFSSSGFIPVEYSGIQLELVGDMKDLTKRTTLQKAGHFGSCISLQFFSIGSSPSRNTTITCANL